MKRLTTMAAFAAAAAAAPAAHAGITITPGCTATCPGAQFFVSGNPASGQVSAFYGRTAVPATASDTDTVSFTILQDGLGSGDVTSISTALNALGDLDLLSVVFNNGVSNFIVPIGGPDGAEGGALNNIPIFNGVLNTLKITYKSYGNGKYSGTLDFVPTAGVPEPATWALMMLGMGAVGFAMRRRRKEQVRVRYAF